MYGRDPYKPPGYGGYGGGGYGYGNPFTDCGPNLVPIIAGILLFLTYCLFIPGFAAPYWVSYDPSGGPHLYAGLWRYCSDPDDADATCYNFVDDDLPGDAEVEDWLTATQALMCISLITLVLGTLLFVYWICSYSRYFIYKAVFICLFFLAFILSLVGVIIAGVNATDDDNGIIIGSNNGDFDWCYYLIDVATSLMLFVPILLICVPSRERYPSYGMRDRFGFQYGGRGPPPPPPMGRPGPPGPMMGGYGNRPEPIAHVYPQSLPRAKPYGGGYGGGFQSSYPTMPYSNRF